MPMKETREKEIKDKILTKTEIRAIYNIVKSEYRYSEDESNHSSLILRLNCQDRTSYESESDELLNDD